MCSVAFSQSEGYTAVNEHFYECVHTCQHVLSDWVTSLHTLLSLSVNTVSSVAFSISPSLLLCDLSLAGPFSSPTPTLDN